ADLNQPKRGAARSEVSLATVVLEADQRTPLSVPRATHHHVADVAPLAGYGPGVEHADAGQHLAAARPKLAPQKLIAAAHRQHHRPGLRGLAQRRALVGDEIRRHNSLLAV